MVCFWIWMVCIIKNLINQMVVSLDFLNIFIYVKWSRLAMFGFRMVRTPHCSLIWNFQLNLTYFTYYLILGLKCPRIELSKNQMIQKPSIWLRKSSEKQTYFSILIVDHSVIRHTYYPSKVGVLTNELRRLLIFKTFFDS